MKEYKVKLNAHYEKTITIYADSPEQAAEKLKIVLFDTDAIQFSEEDFACGEANITDSCKDGSEETGVEDGCLKNSCCSECPCQCPVCGGCCCGDGG